MVTTTKFVWDEDNYLAETDAADTTQAVFTNEPDRHGDLLSLRRAGESRFCHFDVLGSTRQLTSPTEDLTDSFIFEGWGSTVLRTGSTSIPFQWVGQAGYYFDEELGAYWMRRRSCIPSVGRWSSRDASGLTRSSNHYPYVANFAVVDTDPSGESRRRRRACCLPDYGSCDSCCPQYPGWPMPTMPESPAIPEPPSENCCCCVQKAGTGVTQIDKRQVRVNSYRAGDQVIAGWGHDFTHVSVLNYVRSAQKGHCNFEWWECSTSQTPEMSQANIPAFKWHNAFKRFKQGPGTTGGNWADYLAHQGKYKSPPCPGSLTISANDRPFTAVSDRRILNIVIRVYSAAGCPCADSSPQVFKLHQEIDATGAQPDLDKAKVHELRSGLYPGNEVAPCNVAPP